MRVWRSLEEVPEDLGRPVVTIGNFDGVHLGHQHVVVRAREVADRFRDGHVVAVTFDPHPIAVLRPEHAPPTLTTIEQRAELLAAAGVDDVLVVPFTRVWTASTGMTIVQAYSATQAQSSRSSPRWRPNVRANSTAGTASSSRS